MGKGKAFNPLPKPLVGGVAIKDASPGEKYGRGVAFVHARRLPRPALSIKVPGLIEVSGNTEISEVLEIKCESVVQSSRIGWEASSLPLQRAFGLPCCSHSCLV